jgi:carbon-monoxide dehydrogenase iron sulfur subunit
MACPFGVIRYHQDTFAPAEKVVAVKCDNCIDRRQKGMIPACVEVCKSGALTFELPDAAMKRKTDDVARSVMIGGEGLQQADGFNLLNSARRAQIALKDA